MDVLAATALSPVAILRLMSRSIGLIQAQADADVEDDIGWPAPHRMAEHFVPGLHDLCQEHSLVPTTWSDAKPERLVTARTILLAPWHASTTIRRAHYDAGVDYLPTAGKIAVASPRWSGSLNLQYDDAHLFGNFALRYVGSQFSTFMDDQSISSHITSDLTVGYRLSSFGVAKHPRIMLNLMNLGDNHHLSGPSSFTALVSVSSSF